MLAAIAVLILVFWGIGFAVHLFGGLIHIALVVGLILLVMHFMKGKTGSGKPMV